jgi:hypothetical protein
MSLLARRCHHPAVNWQTHVDFMTGEIVAKSGHYRSSLKLRAGGIAIALVSLRRQQEE